MSTNQVLDGTAIAAGFSNLFTCPQASDTARATHAIARRVITINFTDAATAGTLVAESPVNLNPMGVATNPQTNSNGLLLVAAYLVTGIAVTASDTVFATVTLTGRIGSTGGTATVLASQTTKITGGPGNITAFKPVPLTIASTNVVLFPNATTPDVCTFTLAKASTGTALTASTGWAQIVSVWQEL